MSDDDIPFLDRLGEQLRQAEPPGRRDAGPVLRRAAFASVAVVVLALTVTIALGTFRSDPASAEIDVRRIGNRVELRIEGLAPPASTIEEVARRNGLDLRVREVPVGPSEVGLLFVGDNFPADGTVRYGPEDALDTRDHGFRALSFPVNWKGYVELLIGRRAEADEDVYSHPSNALARGEALACLRGHVPDDARSVAAQHDVTIRWWLHQPDGSLLREVSFDASWGAEGYRVAYGMAIGPRSVIVELTPGGKEIVPRWFKRFPSC